MGVGAFSLLSGVGFAYAFVFVCAVFICAAWWGLVLNGWRRIRPDGEDPNPATGAIFLAIGFAIIAVCAASAFTAFRSVQPV
jgi:hypothetical protein